MQKMRKIFLLLLMILLVSSCGKKLDSVSEISYTKLNSMLQNKESFVLMIGAKTCPHCDQFKYTLKQIIKKYQVDIKYIDVDKLNDSQRLELKESFPYTGTPTTINIVSGVEENSMSRIDGDLDYDIVKKRLITWGYIKE